MISVNQSTPWATALPAGSAGAVIRGTVIKKTVISVNQSTPWATAPASIAVVPLNPCRVVQGVQVYDMLPMQAHSIKGSICISFVPTTYWLRLARTVYLHRVGLIFCVFSCHKFTLFI